MIFIALVVLKSNTAVYTPVYYVYTYIYVYMYVYT